jgi:hypothetical protein
MRAALLAVSVVALWGCGPKVSTTTPTFDEDLGPKERAAAPVDELTMERAVAPPGKGMRTGTIARDRLIAILDAGPGAFLRQFEVNARLAGDRFVGWELVQLFGAGTSNPLYDVDVQPGDVLITINGKTIAKPDQLQTIWDGLRTSNEVVAELWRGKTKLTLQFAVEPKL